ncbi:MAG: AMIN domain-containing protein [Gammaproteobacteria bacterium]
MLASIAAPVLGQTLETPSKAVLQIVPGQATETVQISILADRPIETYREFQLQSPPRLVIDIENARLQRNTHIDIDHAAVRNVRAASHPATARIVLDLAVSSR